MSAIAMSAPIQALGATPLSARRGLSARIARPAASLPIGRRSMQVRRSRQMCMVVNDKLVLQFVGDGTCDHLYDDASECPNLPSVIDISEGVTVVGRDDDPASEVARASVPIATVSGTHAAIEVVESGIYVTDLGSTNGTYVDSKELNPNEAEKVFLGSEITFGDQYLAKFELREV